MVMSCIWFIENWKLFSNTNINLWGALKFAEEFVSRSFNAVAGAIENKT